MGTCRDWTARNIMYNSKIIIIIIISYIGNLYTSSVDYITITYIYNINNNNIYNVVFSQLHIAV